MEDELTYCAENLSVPFGLDSLSDFIAPVYDVPLNNFRIILADSPMVDISKYYNSDHDLNLELDENEMDLVFLNEACVYEPLELASLLCSAIEAHGLCPKEVVLDLENNLFLRNKLFGLVDLYFMDDEKTEDFMNFLFTFSGIYNKSEELVSSDNLSKEAQMLPQNQESNWWFFGLIEKMLEPARGSDKEIHDALEKMRSVIQEKVLKVRGESGREGATYEKLLRAVDDDTPGRYVILEKVLSEDRLW